MRYIGSKINLLAKIEAMLDSQLIATHQTNQQLTILDLFAGTNTVGRYFKKKYTIYANDLLYFSHINAKSCIENNEVPSFAGLQEMGIEFPLDYLQEHAEHYLTTGVTGYYEANYTPTGNAMYFSVDNGKRIDFIRDKIDEWQQAKLISDSEYYYLVSVLVAALPYISNITGTYGAFLKHWDKRALNRLELIPLAVENNHQCNQAFHGDANELIKQLTVDIAYIDTPYNNRQYASNYHVLENIARNNKPELKGKTKIFDWSGLRSDYSMKRKALKAMSELIANIDATHVIVSYNNEGIISENELIELMQAHAINNNVVIERIPFRKYKSKKASKTYKLYEILLYIQKKEITNAPKKKALKKVGVKKSELKQIEQQQKERQQTEPVTQSLSTSPIPLANHKLAIKHKPATMQSLKKQTYIKSPLNYIGGKYRLLKQILPLFPTNIDTFVDLFSGGANIGINVAAKRHIFNDMNTRINEMFRFFLTQDEVELVKSIKKRIAEYQLSKTNEAGFLAFRKQYNKDPNPLDLYVLVSYSYNYQFRFNNAMQFNNPFGRNRSQFSNNMEKNLLAFVKQLKTMDVSFIDGFFHELPLSHLSTNDFVYLDPPYLITTGNYNDGNRGFLNWGETQEKQMYALMNELTRQGVRFALSNVIEHKGKSNDMLKAYIDTHNVTVHHLDYHYNNASYNSTNKGSREVLISNYQPKTFNLLTV